MSKLIKDRLKRQCVICGQECRVIFYGDRTYRGGHYFGKIPIYGKKEEDKALNPGRHEEKINRFTINVFNYDPKPYKYEEYWECPTCYWEK